MPNLATVYKWTNKDNDLFNRIMDARKTGAMTVIDQCRDLLNKETPPQEVMLLRERVGFGKWLASKLVGVYGDKQTIENVGEPMIKIVWDDGSYKDKDEVHTHEVQSSDNKNPTDKITDKDTIN
tara:strand:- start:7950 stop:8321 length:372 start_codon:yes stop_codon:yes gene_type:complete